ncbi:MAG: hypothetical protein ACI8T1_000467 [Verrucomicrobiales bacterium]
MNGGDFFSIGDVAASKIAKFDPRTNQCSSLLDFTAGENASGPVSGGAYAVARSGDYVYIGGFLFNHEDPAMRFIRRFNLKTNKWGPVGQGLDWKVETLEVAANGDLYAGGGLTGGLAKWDGT